MNTIIESIDDNATRYANKFCCADEQESMCYGEFYNCISKAASYFIHIGIKKDDVVLIYAITSINYVIAYFAIQSIGAVSCAIDKNLTTEKVTEIASRLRSQFLLGGKTSQIYSVRVLSFKDMRNWTGEMVGEWYLKYFDGPSQISNIIFTTGTTGKPKGIMVSHKADIAIAENVIDSVEMLPDEIELITTALNHSLAIRRISAALHRGSGIILSDSYLFPEVFFGLMDKYRVTAMTLVPAILNIIFTVSQDRIKEYNDALHYIQIGSAPLHENIKGELINMLPNVRLYNTYGMTESGCSIILEFSKYKGKQGCVGRTTVNTQLLFVDENNQFIESTNNETAGRMVFRGGMNMSGYYDDLELTQTILIDGDIYSNDIGYIDTDGLVYFLGRQDDIINSGGIKINPLDIEAIVMNFDGVIDCACVSKPDMVVGEIPILYVVKDKENEIDVAAVMSGLASRLESKMMPREVIFIDNIPRTFNGKIIRSSDAFGYK